IVALSGAAQVAVDGVESGLVGGRGSVFDDAAPGAVYVPAQCHFALTATTSLEVALCSAPGRPGRPPRTIPPEAMSREVRGQKTNTRYVRNILPQTEAADSLLVVEVMTPGGHWSSYPPHKHDNDHGGETQLEETYYHRLARPGGFAFQRVYTDDRTLDETMTVEDRDVVLVPRGYHPVSAAHGFDLYYLNVMAGPVRRWQFTTAPGYEFLTRRS